MKVQIRAMTQGFMCWWDKVEDAAMYHVKLYINDDVICVVDKDRNTLYHSFTDLAWISGYYSSPTGTGAYCGPTLHKTNLNYYVRVEAEDRSGEITDESDKIICEVIKK